MPVVKYNEYIHATNRIYSQKSNRISKESIENITKSDSNFAPTFIDHHSLPNINFCGHCLIKNNISIPKKVIYLYFLHIRSTIKKLKHRFYIK